MVTIASRATFSSSLSQLLKSANQINNISKKLALGKSIISGQDSPALLTRLQNMNSTINGIEIASRNAETARGYLNTADNGLSAINDTLQQIRGLAVQGADDLMPAAARQALNNQSQSLLEGLNNMASTYNFNGTNLLDGSFGSRSIQVGPNEGDTVSINLSDARPTALGVDDIDLGSSATSATALTSLDNALAQVNSARSSTGSALNRIDNTIITNGTNAVNYTVARSLLEDLDIANGMAELTRFKIQYKATLQSFKALLKTEQSKLSILV